MNQPARPSSTSFSSIDPLISASPADAAAAAAEAALGAKAGAAETAGDGAGIAVLAPLADLPAAVIFAAPAPAALADDDDAVASGLIFNSLSAGTAAAVGAAGAAGA